MSMFCYQCQETAKNEGCTIRGVCGKTEETANLQDLLIYVLKGISIWGEKAGGVERQTGCRADQGSPGRPGGRQGQGRRCGWRAARFRDVDSGQR